jgi:hypothetical protein
MRGTIHKVLLSAALACGMLNGVGRAQEPCGDPGLSDCCDGEKGPALGQRIWNKCRPAAVVERWRERGPLGCYSHFNDYSCGSFHADFAFMFGGCRRFFGEQCLKNPPPYPVAGFDPAWLDAPPNDPYGIVQPQPNWRGFKGGANGGGRCRGCP